MENDRFKSKLSAYIDGELDGNLREEVSAHVRNCAVCSKELAEFEQVDCLVKKMPKLEATEAFALDIIAGISRQKRDRLGLHLSPDVSLQSLSDWLTLFLSWWQFVKIRETHWMSSVIFLPFQ